MAFTGPAAILACALIAEPVPIRSLDKGGSALALPASARTTIASADKPGQTVIEAHEGEVVRLSPHQRARFDAITVVYEGAGEVKTAEGIYEAFALIIARCGRRSADRRVRVREPWIWNGYVVEILGVDSSRHARLRLRHAP